MNVETCSIPGLKIIRLAVHGDARGFFVERYNAEKFAEHGLPTAFAQDNHSRSAPGVLRGLHYQADPPQGKLVGVTRGRVWDVAVDIRPFSQTYGQCFGLELSDANGTLLWMPPGFAHGFCVLGDEPADMLYKCTALYNPKGENGIRFDDPALAVPWPLKELAHPHVISERDRSLPGFAEYRNALPDWENILS